MYSNDLLQLDLSIKPTISNFVEFLPKFGYFFLLIIARFLFLLSLQVLFGLLLNEKKK